MNPDAPAGAASSFQDVFERPVFIVSTPRSGSTLLFETLAQAPGLYSIWGESHGLIEGIPAFLPAMRQWASNRLTTEDATGPAVEQLAANFYRALRDREGRPASGRVRMLEKTPKNSLRVGFFDAIWPDAEFIYLYRDVRQTLSSMIEAWRSGGFRTYPMLPGWSGLPWSLVLVPGWQQLNGRPLHEIVAHQWATTTNLLLDDLELLPATRVHAIDYAALIARPQATASALAGSAGLEWDRELSQNLPFSRATVSRPQDDKWRLIEPVIQSVLPIVQQADDRARAFAQGRRAAPAD